MFDIAEIKNEINNLKKNVDQNYDKLLNLYLRLLIEYKYMEKTDEDL